MQRVGMYVPRRLRWAEPHAHIDTMALFSSRSAGELAKVHNAAMYSVSPSFNVRNTRISLSIQFSVS